MIVAALLALSVQPVAPALPAPPVIIPPPIIRISPPPIITAPVPPFVAQSPHPVATVSIIVAAGQERLFNDQLRVGRHGASVNRTRREALTGDCLNAGGTQDHQFHVQLSPDFGRDPDRFRLDVRWGRPFQTGCDVGTRTVSLQTTFELKPGALVVLTGDSGLRVELRR